MAIMAFLNGLIERMLVFFGTWTGNYGIAIILLTLVIRLALFPLTLSQTKSLAAMKELQPRLKELQEKFKDKPQEYQRRVLELYRENKVNPLGGCLPLLVQLPFLFALFNVLRTFEFPSKFLLWDLTASDPFFLLPALAGLTTYVQMAMTATDPSQKAFLYVLPVFIGWLSISFPAGLVLYWVVSNVFSIGQQYVVNKHLTPTSGGGGAK